MLCLLRIVECFGSSFESGKPAHPYCLTRLYTVGFSDSYFDLDIPKMDCLKIKFRQVHCLMLTTQKLSALLVFVLYKHNDRVTYFVSN